MNIFITDACPVVSAKNLPDILVNKMCLESAQLLSTAHIVIDGKQVAYRKTHENHPCAVWCRASVSNYQWLVKHFEALCQEFKYRNDKAHACEALLPVLSVVPKGIRKIEATPIAKCMPDEHKVSCPYQSYKNYLTAKFDAWKVRAKPIVVSWARRGCPPWLPQYKIKLGRCMVLVRC